MLSNNSRRVLAANCCQAVHLICLGKSSVRLYNFLSFAVRLKKAVLFPEIGWENIFLSATRPLNRVCIRIHIFNFKKQKTNSEKRKRSKKKTKEEKRISPENRLKKSIYGRPSEDFSRHPHFRKLEYYFFGLI